MITTPEIEKLDADYFAAACARLEKHKAQGQFDLQEIAE